MTQQSVFATSLLVLAFLVGCIPATTPAPDATVVPQATLASSTLIPVAASATPLAPANVPPLEYECSDIRFTELGTYAALEDAADVAVMGTSVLVTGSGGLRAIDAADPAAPAAAGFLAAKAGYARIVTASGGAIVAAGDSVELIDLSMPDAPVRIGSVPISAPGPIELVWDGGFALARDGLGVVHILEVTAAKGLREISTYDPPGGIWGGEVFGNEMFAKLDRARAIGLPTVALDDGYLYVADLDGGLRVVGLSQAGTPTEVGVHMEDVSPSNVARFGHNLIVFSEEEGEATWSWRVSEFDLPLHPGLADPRELGTLELAGETGVASICSYLSDFISLARSGGSELLLADGNGLGDVAGALRGVANRGETLYVLDPDRGLVILTVEQSR